MINGLSVAAERDQIDALEGDDTVTLGPNQTFISGPGDDNVIGAGGTTQYALWYAQSIPLIDLQQGFALDGFGGRDKLSGIGVVHMSGLGGTVIGSNNNETVYAFGGKKEIDMGPGVDTVIYYQQQSTSYEIVNTGLEFRLRNLSSGLIDILKNIEYIKFSDKTVNVAYDQSMLKAAFQYTAYSFTETGMAPGYVYAGSPSPPGLISWFVQAAFTQDLDGDGKFDIVAPMNKGYATGIDTRVPFIALTGASGRLKFDPIINAKMPVTAGARREESIHLISSGTDGVVTVAHDTGDGKLADLTILTDNLIGSPLLSYVPKLPSALPNRDYAVNAHSMAVGDINGDGFDDVLIGDWSSPNGMYALIQQSDGRFNISYQDSYRLIISNWSMTNPTPGQQNNLLIDLHLVDVNGDGYDDLIAGWGHGSTHSYVFLNNRGIFSIANKIALPDSIYGIDNQLHLRTFHFDFNNDGIMDLAILWSRFVPYYGGNYIQLLQNDGSGKFTDVTSTRIDKPAQDALGGRLQWTNYWQLLDINGDGAIDIVGQRTGASSAPVAYLNDGSGHFTVTEIPTSGLDVGQIIKWADFDRDGTVEMVGYRSVSDATETSTENQFNVYKLTGDALLPMRSNPVKSGSMLSDVLVGNNANEMLIGKQGNDNIDGDTGIDTAVFTGNRAGYVLSKSTNGINVADQTQGRDGTDRLQNIEVLRFADMSVDLTMGTQAASIPASSLKTLEELYVGFFNRVPEAAGLSYWIGQLKSGVSLPDVANQFYSAGVQFGVYSASMTNDQFITTVYANVLGRSGATAPPQSDINYWSNRLITGVDTKGTMVLTMLHDSHAYFTNDPVVGWVIDLLDNKATVANYFAVQQGLSYNVQQDNITKGIEIAARITATDTSSAIALIGVNEFSNG